MSGMGYGIGRGILNNAAATTVRAAVLADILAYEPLVWLSAGMYAGSADSAVSSVPNLGTLGGNFVQANAAKMPTFRTGGLLSKPSFQFDGGDCLTLANVPLSTFKCIAVFRSTVAGMLCEHSATANTNNGHYFLTSSGATTRVRRSGADAVAGFAYVSSWGSDDTPRIAEHWFGGNGATHFFYINGSVVLSGSGGTPNTTEVTDTLNVGARNDAAAAPVTGHYPELLFFPYATDITPVRNILNSVFGVY
jgi:hypothetical protein